MRLSSRFVAVDATPIPFVVIARRLIPEVTEFEEDTDRIGGMALEVRIPGEPFELLLTDSWRRLSETELDIVAGDDPGRSPDSGRPMRNNTRQHPATKPADTAPRNSPARPWLGFISSGLDNSLADFNQFFTRGDGHNRTSDHLLLRGHHDLQGKARDGRDPENGLVPSACSRSPPALPRSLLPNGQRAPNHVGGTNANE